MNFLKYSTLFIAGLLYSNILFANENIKWTGVLQESKGFHSTNHTNEHSLVFVSKETGKTFDVEDNQELISTHTEKDKKLLIEVEGEVTPHFLFWGGNLIIKSYKILEDLEPMVHYEPTYRSRATQEFHGRQGRL